MENSVVLFKPRIHLFACTLPSVSNTLDCFDWLACKHQSTALCSNTWFLAVHKHKSPPLCFKHVWMVVPCLSSISLSPCVSTRLDFGSLFVKHQSLALCFNTSGFWLLVCVHSPVNSPVFKHVWTMVPCLCTLTSQQPFVSNTFDCGCLLVGLSQNGHGMGQTETPLREEWGFVFPSFAVC